VLFHVVVGWTIIVGRAERALGQCVGMFTIARWDRDRGLLSLARDRVGETPLYVGRCRGGLAFACELSALRTLPGGPNAIEPAALAASLRHGYVPAPMSMLRDAVKLESDTIATLAAPVYGSATTTRSWSVRDAAMSGLATSHTGSDDARV
jgi:asparagine synthase (glutamine-hydrolysing)